MGDSKKFFARARLFSIADELSFPDRQPIPLLGTRLAPPPSASWTAAPPFLSPLFLFVSFKRRACSRRGNCGQGGRGGLPLPDRALLSLVTGSQRVPRRC